MECKLEFIRRKHIWFCELIDTLWNVNLKGETGNVYFAGELIDTLWNVNKSVSDGDKVYVGINRYIMECKCLALATVSTWLSELIDTLWNVNLFILFNLFHLMPN